MSVIFCGFNADWHTEVIEQLASTLGVEDPVIISGVNHVEKVFSNGTYHNLTDLELLNYNEYHFENLNPVDVGLVRQLSECQAFYLMMLDRREISLGRRISYRDRLNDFYKKLQIVCDILDSKSIELCIFDYVPHVPFTWLLYNVCKVKKIRTIMQYQSFIIPNKVASRYSLEDVYNHIPEMENMTWPDTEVELSERMEACINYYDGDSSSVTSIVTFDQFREKSGRLSKALVKIHNFVSLLANKNFNQIKIRLMRRKLFNHQIKLNDIALSRLKDTPVFDENYFYFPLHYQPECTSMPLGDKL